MTRSWYFVATLLVAGLGGTPSAEAQSFLNKLEGSLKDGMNSVLAKPGTAKIVSSGGVMGLVGDDTGAADQGVRVLSVRPKGPADQAGVRPNGRDHGDQQAGRGRHERPNQGFEGR